VLDTNESGAHCLRMDTPTVTALLGQACGDAFGAPFEYQAGASRHARNSIEQRRYLCASRDVGQEPSYRYRQPGLYTDDTQQAMLLVHMRTREGCEASGSAESFHRWCTEMAELRVCKSSFGVHRGTGRNFRNFVTTGLAVETAGLGAAMRVGPVSCCFPDARDAATWVLAASEAMTSSPTALAGALKFAMWCWSEANGERAVEVIEELELPALLREALRVSDRAGAILEKEGEGALIAFAMANGSHKQLRSAADGFALGGVEWVLHSVERASGYEDALVRVCSSGGDTDTVGAMAGCLAALKWGVEAIPTWMVAGLVGRAGLTGETDWHPVASEAALTGGEEEFRRSLKMSRRK